MSDFSMRKSIYGNYVAVRVRDDRGESDAVDQMHSAAETRSIYTRLCREMTPMQTPDELEAQIERTWPDPEAVVELPEILVEICEDYEKRFPYSPPLNWTALMDSPAFRAYCEAGARADEAERRAERDD